MYIWIQTADAGLSKSGIIWVQTLRVQGPRIIGGHILRANEYVTCIYHFYKHLQLIQCFQNREVYILICQPAVLHTSHNLQTQGAEIEVIPCFQYTYYTLDCHIKF